MNERVSMIAAIGKDTRAIGKDGGLLFRIPEDLKRFKELTMGHPVIMGRKTWESLPQKSRPLPGRTNIVVTRDPTYSAPGAQVVHSLEEAYETGRQSPGNDEIFIIGGGELYHGALSKADRLYLTRVFDDTPGDVVFPSHSEFDNIVTHSSHPDTSPPHEFVILERG